MSEVGDASAMPHTDDTDGVHNDMLNIESIDDSNENLTSNETQEIANSNNDREFNSALTSSVVGESMRLRRKVKLSNIGRESRISELNLKLTKQIMVQYKLIDKVQHNVIRETSIDTLYEICDSVDARIIETHDMYNELVALCSTDMASNKMIETIKPMYDGLVITANSLKDSVEEHMETLEELQLQEAQQKIAEANREIEEQARLFEEMVRERESSSNYSSTCSVMHSVEQINRAVNQTKEPELPSIEGDRHNTTRIEQEQAQSCREVARVTEQIGVNVESRRNPTRALPDKSKSTMSTSDTTKSELSVVEQLAACLTATFRSSNKSVEPSVFEGNVLEFNDWEVDLDSYFCAEHIEGSYRLRHLKRFLKGEAKICVEGHFSTNTNDAYLAARTTLKSRYGNEQNIARSFRMKLDKWPKIASKDGLGLRDFGDFLSHLRSAMQSVKTLQVLNDCIENERMVEKLPEWLRLKWIRVVAKADSANKTYPDFKEFAEFINEEAHIMTLPISQTMISLSHKPSKHNQSDKPSTKDRAIKSFAASIEQKKECICCKSTNHNTADCYRLQKRSKPEKEELIRKNGLCFKCLGHGHRSKDCDKKISCMKCKKGHATANHDSNYQYGKATSNTGGSNRADAETKPQKTMKAHSTTKVLKCQITEANNLTSMAVPVYISAGTGCEMLVYALLDNMSDACYVSKDVVATLKARTSETEKNVTIHTINGPVTEDIERFDDIMLRGYLTNSYAHISAYKREYIYCDRNQLPTKEKAARLDHLKNIATQFPPLMDIPVGLLIGMNATEVIQPLETRPAVNGKMGKAYGVRTLFGWTMCGGTLETIYKSRKTAYKADTSKDVRLLNILERDFQDTNEDSYLSQNDVKFTKILETSTQQNAAGNYVMPLPFKSPLPILPNNKKQAEHRLHILLRKFSKDFEYKCEYTTFMNNLIKAGHAEEATSAAAEAQVWYIPHFGVRHKQKRKLRVVFDASSKFNGVSLNDMLLPGPDHINSLLGILIRFRREPVAITCDIQQMYYNFLVVPEHRDYLRFLWMNDGGEVKEFKMNVHLFGATSSPGVATFGLRRLANDYKSLSPLASKFLQNEFYVDDGVTSVATAEDAKGLITASREMCSKGNIRLHKFLSNNKEVLATVPISERGESTKAIDLLTETLPSERTLGMKWCLETDTFHFGIPELQNKPSTKRGALSTIAQIYDPMGLISPLVLKGKQILQKVVASEQLWDQLMCPDDKQKWEDWRTEITNLTALSIPRCFKTETNIVSTELHHFSDASLNGYGACSYIKQVNDSGKISCNLILAKSRVAPLKKPTIPRLELQGAVTATRLANVLRKELKLSVDKETFWSDSQIVLGYISNDVRKFHLYVANRVSEIRKTTEPKQWNYVPTEFNPADIASRGISAKEIIDNDMWWNGPPFLRDPVALDFNKQNRVNTTVNESDPEVRKKGLVTMATFNTPSITRKFTRFSSWKKLVHSIALLKSFVKQKQWMYKELKTNDLKEAEALILKMAQAESYPMKEKEKSLIKLNPKIDDEGIVRVGGRASASTLSYQQKYPIIIPKNSHLAYLLTVHYHKQISHLGRRSTLAAIRDAGIWMVNGSGVVKRVLNQCVGCARLRKAPETQLMGELPKERMEATPPFTNIGIDTFGPYYVKDKRTELKRWGLLITCLYSRAVHIEALDDMSADTLIQALRCFMALRGPVQTIYCDNGTNFVGAKNEIEKQLEITSKETKQYLLENRIHFKFNSPEASHQGGAMERMIRSVRAVLNAMTFKLKNKLDTKTLRTFFYEAGNIINSRPLTATSTSDPKDHVITPNHILTMKSQLLLAPPPGNFTEDDLYSSKRWKIAQAAAEEFWKTWKTEYLNSITIRQKWTRTRPNVKKGDIVIVKDNQAARNDWKLGRVTETISGSDGLVRNLKIKIGNRFLDKKGLPMHPPTVLQRSVHSVVVLLST